MALTIIECIRVGRHIRLEAHAASRIHPASDGVAAAAPAPAHNDQNPATLPPADGANAPLAAYSTNLVRHSYTMLHDVAQTNTQATGLRTSRNMVELGRLIMFARQSLADIRPSSRTREAATLVFIILLLLLSPPSSGGRRITIAFTLPTKLFTAIPRNKASPIFVVVFLWSDAPPVDAADAALSPLTISGGGDNPATAAIDALALSLGLFSESSRAVMSFDVDDGVGVILVVDIVAAAASDPAPSLTPMSPPSNDGDDDDDNDPGGDDSNADEEGVGVEGDSAVSSSPSQIFRPDTIHSLHFLAFAATLSFSSLRASLSTSSLLLGRRRSIRTSLLLLLLFSRRS